MYEAGERVKASKLQSVGAKSGSKTKTAEDAMWDPKEGKRRNRQDCFQDWSRQHGGV